MDQLSAGLATAFRSAFGNEQDFNTPMINAVSPKLPPFDSDDAKLWFAAIEEEFSVKGIWAASTKYSHAVAAIDAPNRSTTEQRIQRILDFPPLDPSERPSLWLARARLIAGSGVDLNGQWPLVILLRKLPSHVRELASVQQLKTISAVIVVADDLSRSNQPGCAQMSAVKLANRQHIDGV